MRLGLAFLFVALIAVVLGFGGVRNNYYGVAQVLFFVFFVVGVLTFLRGALKRPSG